MDLISFSKNYIRLVYNKMEQVFKHFNKDIKISIKLKIIMILGEILNKILEFNIFRIF